MNETDNSIRHDRSQSNIGGTPQLQPVNNEPFKFENGAIFTGEWEGSDRHGYGVQVWPDGAKYDG